MQSLTNLNIFLHLGQGAILPVDLLPNVASEALVPVLGLLVDAVMKTL